MQDGVFVGEEHGLMDQASQYRKPKQLCVICSYRIVFDAYPSWTRLVALTVPKTVFALPSTFRVGGTTSGSGGATDTRPRGAPVTSLSPERGGTATLHSCTSRRTEVGVNPVPRRTWPGQRPLLYFFKWCLRSLTNLE